MVAKNKKNMPFKIVSASNGDAYA